MDFSIVIVALAGIGAVLAIIVLGTRHEERMQQLKRGGGEVEMKGVVDEMHAEIVKLKTRVQVLERLVTDDDRKLSHEIEQLRPRA